MEVLSTENIAAVFSITSRGIFLRFNNNRMIFLSFENYRGPLTANLSGISQQFSSCSSGETVSTSRHGIRFSDSDISISTSNAKAWNPLLPIETPLHTDERINLIRQLALNVYRSKSDVGMSKMLPALVGFNREDSNQDNQFKGIRNEIYKIKDHLTQGDLISLFQTIQLFLGMGSGLTPSGDDFIMGLLLSLNRWESVLQPGKDLSILNKNVIEAAYRDTTTLSANLIESAALGLADERLIQAVDFLAVGKVHQAEILPGFLNWGNSSGIDALVGMITAFLPI